MTPDITNYISNLPFLFVPAMAVIFALVMKKKYSLVAIFIALLSVPLLFALVNEENTCTGEMCGLGVVMGLAIFPTILGAISIIVALIGPSIVPNGTGAIKKDHKKLKIILALLLLAICLPRIIYVLQIIFFAIQYK